MLRDLRDRLISVREDPYHDDTLPSWWWRSVAALGCAVVLAALAGWLLGSAIGGGPAEPLPAPDVPVARGVIEGGGLELVTPAGWATDPRPARIAGTGMRKPIALRDEAEAVLVLAERLHATSTTLLPVGLLRRTRKSLGRSSEARFADGLRGYRYAFVGIAHDAWLVVDAAPTSAGIATVACLGNEIEAAIRACDTVVPTVSVPNSRPLSLSVDAAFRTRLPEAIQALSGVRMAARQTLATASGPTAQARAASGLRHAYQTGSTPLEPLVPKKGATAARTLAELRAAAGAYGLLARAAKAGDSRAYTQASRAVTAAERRLDDLLAG
jgi:hypothetical protein